MWKCKNPECMKTFPLTGRISIEKTPAEFNPQHKRIIVEKPCCPFCESIEFEEVTETKTKGE